VAARKAGRGRLAPQCTGRSLKVGGTETVEVPTGGHPDEALATVASRWVEPGASYRFTVAHDDDCPCVTGVPLTYCECEVIRILARRVK
jgi:hypothetical protein